MAISFVNGFMCTSSCDVAKAQKGEDPHPNLPTLDEPTGNRDATARREGSMARLWCSAARWLTPRRR
jgi:hypothetical protein